MPAVSIILPAYNSASFVRQTIDSVLAQDCIDWELIIVNDGSQDMTSAVVRGIDPRIVLIEQNNRGIASARNTGIRVACARLIAFIDHDDYWHPQKLSTQMKALLQHPEVGVVYGEFLSWDPATSPHFPEAHLDPELVDRKLSGWIYHRMLETNWVLFSTAIFRSEVFERVGLFADALPPADDWDMALRSARQFQMLKLAQPLALYRQHALQTSRKAVALNAEAEFRERAINEFGLRGPDGQTANSKELCRRQFTSWLNHASLHLARGDLHIARASSIKALRLSPLSARAWRTLLRGHWKSFHGRLH